VLAAHAPRLRVDAVVADTDAVTDAHGLMSGVSALGARLVLAPVAAGDGTARHDPARLAAAYGTVLEELPAVVSRRPECVRRGTGSGDTPVAMTASVKDELSRLSVTKTCDRRAEISALLRFAGGLHIVGGGGGRGRARHRLDRAPAAPGHRRGVRARQRGAGARRLGLRKGNRYIVRVVKDGEGLARQTGLLDQRGRPVRGLPPQVVSGGVCDAEAAWRGAFLAHGSLTEPGRSSSLEITCPGPRRRWRWSARPAGWASRPRRARCAGSTGWWSATATRSARC
jgi:hypothetical protein